MNALKLQTVKTERLEIATFGDKKQETEAVNLVELNQKEDLRSTSMHLLFLTFVLTCKAKRKLKRI